VPGLAWLVYFYSKGRREKTQFRNVLRVFLWGCACTAPTYIVLFITGASLFQESVATSAWVSFGLIGPIEEFFKLAAVWVGIYRHRDFREPIDGIIYAATAALGFATVENIVYLGSLGPTIVMSRALFATPAHVMFSSMWGYSMGLGRFRREGELLIVAKGLILASLFHGSYDFLVALDPAAAKFSLIPLMLLMAWLMNRRIKEFKNRFPFASLGEGALVVCANCGALVPEEEDACPRCEYVMGRADKDTTRFCGRCRARLDPRHERCGRCGVPMGLSHFNGPSDL
jgi:protease PrsW